MIYSFVFEDNNVAAGGGVFIEFAVFVETIEFCLKHTNSVVGLRCFLFIIVMVMVNTKATQHNRGGR